MLQQCLGRRSMSKSILEKLGLNRPAWPSIVASVMDSNANNSDEAVQVLWKLNNDYHSPANANWLTILKEKTKPNQIKNFLLRLRSLVRLASRSKDCRQNRQQFCNKIDALMGVIHTFLSTNDSDRNRLSNNFLAEKRQAWHKQQQLKKLSTKYLTLQQNLQDKKKNKKIKDWSLFDCKTLMAILNEYSQDFARVNALEHDMPCDAWRIQKQMVDYLQEVYQIVDAVVVDNMAQHHATGRHLKFAGKNELLYLVNADETQLNALAKVYSPDIEHANDKLVKQIAKYGKENVQKVDDLVKKLEALIHGYKKEDNVFNALKGINYLFDKSNNETEFFKMFHIIKEFSDKHQDRLKNNIAVGKKHYEEECKKLSDELETLGEWKKDLEKILQEVVSTERDTKLHTLLANVKKYCETKRESSTVINELCKSVDQEEIIPLSFYRQLLESLPEIVKQQYDLECSRSNVINVLDELVEKYGEKNIPHIIQTMESFRNKNGTEIRQIAKTTTEFASLFGTELAEVASTLKEVNRLTIQHEKELARTANTSSKYLEQGDVFFKDLQENADEDYHQLQHFNKMCHDELKQLKKNLQAIEKIDKSEVGKKLLKLEEFQQQWQEIEKQVQQEGDRNLSNEFKGLKTTYQFLQKNSKDPYANPYFINGVTALVTKLNERAVKRLQESQEELAKFFLSNTGVEIAASGDEHTHAAALKIKNDAINENSENYEKNKKTLLNDAQKEIAILFSRLIEANNGSLQMLKKENPEEYTKQFSKYMEQFANYIQESKKINHDCSEKIQRIEHEKNKKNEEYAKEREKSLRYAKTRKQELYLLTGITGKDELVIPIKDSSYFSFLLKGITENSELVTKQLREYAEKIQKIDKAANETVHTIDNKIKENNEQCENNKTTMLLAAQKQITELHRPFLNVTGDNAAIIEQQLADCVQQVVAINEKTDVRIKIIETEKNDKNEMLQKEMLNLFSVKEIPSTLKNKQDYQLIRNIYDKSTTLIREHKNTVNQCKTANKIPPLLHTSLVKFVDEGKKELANSSGFLAAVAEAIQHFFSSLLPGLVSIAPKKAVHRLFDQNVKPAEQQQGYLNLSRLYFSTI